MKSSEMHLYILLLPMTDLQSIPPLTAKYMRFPFMALPKDNTSPLLTSINKSLDTPLSFNRTSNKAPDNEILASFLNKNLPPIIQISNNGSLIEFDSKRFAFFAETISIHPD